MHFSYAILALAAAVAVNGQSLPAVPSCSLQCFTTALTSDGCSSLTDFKCHCAKPQLIAQIQPCVAKACSAADQATVQSVVEKTCADAGVPISLPGGGSSSAAASSTPPASSTLAPASSSTPPPSSSEAASSTSSTSVAGPTFTTSASSTVAPPATTAASSPSEANASTPAAFTGGAAHVQGTIGGVAAFLFAAAYVL